MSDNIPQVILDPLLRLIKSLQLKDIQFVEVTSRRTEIGPAPDPAKGELNLASQQQFADGDPLQLDDDVVLFRPKYEFALTQGEKLIFQVSMISAIQFSVQDRNEYEATWSDQEVRKAFYEKQLLKTMWPILRQQLMDCMSRHSLQPVPLQWIL
jgi:hypothetical protein